MERSAIREGRCRWQGHSRIALRSIRVTSLARPLGVAKRHLQFARTYMRHLTNFISTERRHNSWEQTGRSAMPTLRSQIRIGAAAFLLGALIVTPTFAQPCTGPLRKINVGVAVAPPNVVHTAPYIAKALGFFAKRCIDANIIQFDGGLAGTSVTAVGQGTAISTLP